MTILHDQLLKTEAIEKESDEIIRRATELISNARRQIQHVRNLQAARESASVTGDSSGDIQASFMNAEP